MSLDMKYNINSCSTKPQLFCLHDIYIYMQKEKKIIKAECVSRPDSRDDYHRPSHDWRAIDTKMHYCVLCGVNKWLPIVCSFQSCSTATG